MKENGGTPLEEHRFRLPGRVFHSGRIAEHIHPWFCLCLFGLSNFTSTTARGVIYDVLTTARGWVLEFGWSLCGHKKAIIPD